MKEGASQIRAKSLIKELSQVHIVVGRTQVKHTCTSWYAYAAMFGSSHSYAQHSSHSDSLYIDCPCFGSHNLWLQYYIHGNLFLIIQILAQALALSWPDL